MKKLVYLIAATALAFSCSDDGLFNSEQNEQMPTKLSMTRSVDDAISIAENVLSSHGTISRSEINIDRSAVHIIDAPASRSGVADTLLYAVDMGEDNGFVIVSAPKTVEPIMAIIDNGSYNDPDNFGNEPYQKQLEQLKNYVANKKIGIGGGTGDTRLPIDLTLYEYWDSIKFNIEREPSVKVAWNQSWPENIYAPNKVAGCVPVAIAQILSAFELPQNIEYTFENKDRISESLDWKQIKCHKRSMRTYSSSDYDTNFSCLDCSLGHTNSIHNTIGRLVREIGHRAHANYESFIKDGELVRRTGVNTSAYAAQTIQNITGINYFKSGKSPLSLCMDFREGNGVALIWGGDHAWIADGVICLKDWLCHYVWDSEFKEYRQEVVKNMDISLIHYNWGWGGNCNGYFRDTVQKPSNAEDYDFPDEFNFSSSDYTGEKLSYIFYKLSD